ncbi:MAG: hypothetical protein HY219_02310 [Candidatus Staskawiczbacteria bacterium]|nr:hypothetical protein [Candidatus Staskawiczbacteria bacterium]
MNINKKNIIIIFFILSLIGNVFLIGNYFLERKDLIKAQKNIEQDQINKKVIVFGNLFIEKVLKSEKDVSFDDRLALETAVRDLNDQEILSQWQKFTEAKVKEDAQKEVKNLLGLLLNKIKR